MRLDDLSTYEKIAFYKLVSRKELEGIADEGGRKEAGKAKEVREGGKGEVRRGKAGGKAVEREGTMETERIKVRRTKGKEEERSPFLY